MSQEENGQITIPPNVYIVINSQVFPIKKSRVTIGRKLDNDLVIHDNLISRCHAEIRYEDKQFSLLDLDSTGGTFLNNKKIKKSVLYSGDIILLANVPIMFVDQRESLEKKSSETTGKLADNNGE